MGYPLEAEHLYSEREKGILEQCASVCEELKRIVNDFSNQVRLGGRLDTLQMRNLVLKIYQTKMLLSQLPRVQSSSKDIYKISSFIEFEKKISRISMRALSDQTGWLNDLYQAVEQIQFPTPTQNPKKNFKKTQPLLSQITNETKAISQVIRKGDKEIHPELRNKGFIIVRSDPSGDVVLWIDINDISNIFSREEITGRGVISVEGQWVPIRGCSQLQYGFAIQLERSSFVLGVKEVLGFSLWENSKTQGARNLQEWLGKINFGVRDYEALEAI